MAYHLQQQQPCMVACILQDEVEIVHQEGDEQQRQADVEDKIISQVDQLVEYFNSLFHDDQIDIRCATGSAAEFAARPGGC